MIASARARRRAERELLGARTLLVWYEPVAYERRRTGSAMRFDYWPIGIAVVVALLFRRDLANVLPVFRGNGFVAYLVIFAVAAAVLSFAVPALWRLEVRCTSTGVLRIYGRAGRYHFTPYARIERAQVSDEREYAVVAFDLRESGPAGDLTPVRETAVARRLRAKLIAVLEENGVRVCAAAGPVAAPA